MKTKVRLLSALLFGLGALVSPVASLAEAPDRLKSLNVSAWLEYDRPGVLYIYTGELPQGTSFPAQVSFRLPKSSGGPTSTAGIDAAGNYRYIRPVLSEDDDTITVTYETNWSRFQLEYYDDSIQRQGQNGRLDLVYRADYAIDQLDMEVKEPYAATNWSLDPAGGTQSRGDDNLTVYRRAIGPAAAGQEIRWQVSYTKGDSRLAAEALGFPTPSSSKYEAGPGVPQSASASDRVPLVILLGIAATALGGTAYWYFSKSAGAGRVRPRPAEYPELSPRQRKRSRRQAKTVGTSQSYVSQGYASQNDASQGDTSQSDASEDDTPEADMSEGEIIGYCHLCGTAFLEGDVFCHKCGTRRRMD